MHWKKEGNMFSLLQKEIRMHAIREVKKKFKKIGEHKQD